MFFINAALTVIATPSVCAVTLAVFTSNVYEKSLCYIKAGYTHPKSVAFCTNLKMQLYLIKSSAASNKTIIEFGKITLGGNSNTGVYVSGTQGTKCLVFYGNGKSVYELCTIIRYLVCEFNEKGFFVLIYFELHA
jgi:hypothetical protein